MKNKQERTVIHVEISGLHFYFGSLTAIYTKFTPEGEINPMSQFLITILAEVARMERKTIRERVASGYQNFRSNGGKVGRKVGYSKSNETMKEEYAEEIRLLKRGYSLRNTAKLTGTSVNTLRKLTALM